MRKSYIGWLTSTTADTAADTHTAIIDRCRALMTNPAPESEAEASSVFMVEPATDVIYGSTLYVTVDTANFDIDADSGDHWHLWIDGQLNTMVYDDSVAVQIEPGTHEICAILGDPEHFDLGQPDGMTITVVQPGPGTPSTRPLSAGGSYAAPISEAPNSGLIFLIVGAGVVAGVLGWLMGRMLPRRSGQKST
ncbi:MAG: hypothetical protein SF029_01470 [bacterium]|nr:hypothetical protein [bacterium]